MVVDRGYMSWFLVPTQAQMRHREKSFSQYVEAREFQATNYIKPHVYFGQLFVQHPN